MRKRVILTLTGGSFEQGFPVILRIRESGTSGETETQGMMPPAPELLQVFNSWQSAYNQLQSTYRIRQNPGQITNFSIREVASLGLQVEKCLNEWLNSDLPGCRKIREKLLSNLSETDKIQFFIQTEDMRIRKFPWHSWDLVSKVFTKAEIILSVPDYQLLPSQNYTKKVRILAILGDTTDINVEQDRTFLEQLLPDDVEIKFIKTPQRQDLDEQLLNQQWDILFFAGHSGSQVNSNNGVIYISQNDSLTINQLKYGLGRARENGLQLAIFNSCDGLGLAQDIADLNIPQTIVMRVPVPDFVAQQFLKYFLQAFVVNGKPLHLAVREARERLQGLEDRYPCASWLPVLCQNPNTEPLIWQQMTNYRNVQPTRQWQLLPFALLSLLVAALGIRILPQLFSSLSLFYSGDIDLLDKSCNKIKLDVLNSTEENAILLTADCKRDNGSINSGTSINLNNYIENQDGTLYWKHNGNFYQSCKKVSLTDNRPTVLSYKCPNVNGEESSIPKEFELKDRIINSNGDLKYQE